MSGDILTRGIPPLASTSLGPKPHSERSLTPCTPPSSSCNASSHSMPAPPLAHRRFLRRTVPLPRVTAGRSHLHNVLQASVPPQIQWDILTSPMGAVRSHCEVLVGRNTSWLLEPATNPPCHAMTIRVEGCDNVIAVFAGPSNTSYITILDVFMHVHQAPQFAFPASHSRPHRPGRSMMTADGDALNAVQNGSLLLGIDWPPVPVRQHDNRVGAEVPSKRHEELERQSEMDGRRWIGLRPSNTEQDVWSLVLK